jgi:hypothetical protein
LCRGWDHALVGLQVARRGNPALGELLAELHRPPTVEGDLGDRKNSQDCTHPV